MSDLSDVWKFDHSPGLHLQVCRFLDCASGPDMINTLFPVWLKHKQTGALTMDEYWQIWCQTDHALSLRRTHVTPDIGSANRGAYIPRKKQAS